MTSWIRVARTIKSDPKVQALALRIRVSREAAIGLLVELWCELPDHARDGRIADVPDETLELWSGWRGRRGGFADAFRTLFQTPDGVVHAWDRHNGVALEKLDRDRQRLAEHRKRPAPVAQTSRERRATKPRTSRERRASVAGNGTVRNEELLTPGGAIAPPSVSWPARFAGVFAAHIGVVEPGELGAALAPVVAQHGEEAVERALAAWAKQAPHTEKPQYLNARAFARQAAAWVERSKPIPVYDERGEMSPEFARAMGRA